MQVNLKLMGLLKEKAPSGDVLELPDGATIQDALDLLQIPPESVQVCTVNGGIALDRGRELADGDNLQILPPVGGG